MKNINQNRLKMKIILGLTILILFDLLFEFYLVKTRDVIITSSYLSHGIYTQAIMFVSGIILYLLFIGKEFKSILNVHKWHFRYVLYFTLIFPFVLAIVYLLVYLFDSFTWIQLVESQIPSFAHLKDIIFFESIFPGLGEEVLFRGFGLVLLLNGYFIYGKNTKKSVVLIAIVAIAFIFSFAHINYQFDPFGYSYDSYQLITALFMGIVEGYVFYKTRNILIPIIIHNVSNLFLSFIPIVISLIF